MGVNIEMLIVHMLEWAEQESAEHRAGTSKCHIAKALCYDATSHAEHGAWPSDYHTAQHCALTPQAMLCLDSAGGQA